MRFSASLCLACLSWPSPTFLKTRCPGGPTPREAFNMHICGSTKACVILAMSVQRQMPVLRMKNFDETMTKTQTQK